MKIAPLKLWPSLILVTLLLVLTPQALAFSLPDLLKPVQDLIGKTPLGSNSSDNQLTISSSISLAEHGDVNSNGQIDAGEIVTFKFTITNPTSEEYKYATLKTNIERGSLNFIHNVKGVTGIDDQDNNLSLANLRIAPSQTIEASFDARINYYSDQDKVISTEPEFLTQDKKSLLKTKREQIMAKRIDPQKIPSLTKLIKKGKN